MPTFTLKRYPDSALLALETYLRSARLLSARSAFEQQTGYGYNPEPFGDTPCVCLRIPTGGGKTLLAAHAVGRMAREWPAVGPASGAPPLALWLVPSDTIRTQTLAALATPGHPFREALAQGCGDSVRVCDLDTVATLAPQDFDDHAVVVVATIQSFRIEDAEQRNRFVDQPRWSLANWLALRQPLVIVDEAHNTKTERSFEALKRLNPSLILELTATPTPKRTNVLFHVSAQQLQAEHMIKMPITLIEHPRGWQAAVFDAVQNQRLLEALAQQEEAGAGPNQGSYLRPIVLLQAQNSSDPVNVDVLRAHLMDELHIPADQVVVAAGTERGLDGLDLDSRACPVRFHHRAGAARGLGLPVCLHPVLGAEHPLGHRGGAVAGPRTAHALRRAAQPPGAEQGVCPCHRGRDRHGRQRAGRPADRRHGLRPAGHGVDDLAAAAV